MQIVRHKPITRGVTELMYVGDDEAVENATKWTTDMKIAVGLTAAGVLWALFGKSKKRSLGLIPAVLVLGI